MTDNKNKDKTTGRIQQKNKAIDRPKNKQVDRWKSIAGFMCALIAIGFFIFLLYTHKDISNDPITRYSLSAILAFFVALAVFFIGGNARIWGESNKTMNLGKLKMTPIRFAAGGGIAVFIIIFLLSHSILASDAVINSNIITEPTNHQYFSSLYAKLLTSQAKYNSIQLTPDSSLNNPRFENQDYINDIRDHNVEIATGFLKFRDDKKIDKVQLDVLLDASDAYLILALANVAANYQEIKEAKELSRGAAKDAARQAVEYSNKGINIISMIRNTYATGGDDANDKYGVLIDWIDNSEKKIETQFLFIKMMSFAIIAHFGNQNDYSEVVNAYTILSRKDPNYLEEHDPKQDVFVRDVFTKIP